MIALVIAFVQTGTFVKTLVQSPSPGVNTILEWALIIMFVLVYRRFRFK